MGPPAGMLRPPAPGHALYLPEVHWGEPDLPQERAIAVTAHHLARWADRIFARRTVSPPGFTSGSLPFQIREEPLPSGTEARRAAIDDLLRWLRESEEGRVVFSDVELNRGERSVLNAHDGFPGVLHLTPRQYARAQKAWRAHDLPDDLYYPASAQRTVVEPVEVPGLGPPRRLPRSYSPRAWERRDAAAIEAIHVPNEDERRAAFSAACDAFHQAVLVRMQDFHPDGSSRHSEEYEELQDLWAHAHSAFFRFGSPALHMRDTDMARVQLPTAGFSPDRHPSARESLEAALPALRGLHPRAAVHRMRALTVQPGSQVGRWELGVWDRGATALWHHYVRRGLLLSTHGPLVAAHWDPAPCPPLADLSTGEVEPFLDHPRAVEIAESHGAAGFCQRTGGVLTFVDLRCYGTEPARLLWRLEYWGGERNEAEPWRAPSTRFRVALDALTGEVVAAGPVQD